MVSMFQPASLASADVSGQRWSLDDRQRKSNHNKRPASYTVVIVRSGLQGNQGAHAAVEEKIRFKLRLMSTNSCFKARTADFFCIHFSFWNLNLPSGSTVYKSEASVSRSKRIDFAFVRFNCSGADKVDCCSGSPA
jgi:hypothetical protein